MAIDSSRRLHHAIPAWVQPGPVFHIRIRTAGTAATTLTGPSRAAALLASARFYHDRHLWFCPLLLLMPDHLHALIAFPRQAGMSEVIGKWKAWHHRRLGIDWQEGYFDHRLRNGNELQSKADYIRQNPVVKGLCLTAEAWPWVLRHDPPSSAAAGTPPPTWS